MRSPGEYISNNYMAMGYDVHPNRRMYGVSSSPYWNILESTPPKLNDQKSIRGVYEYTSVAKNCHPGAEREIQFGLVRQN